MRRNPNVEAATGHGTSDATLLEVLAAYAEALHQVNGRLHLSGLSEQVREEIARSGKLDLARPVHTYAATSTVGESTRAALADARTWLVSSSEDAADERSAAYGDR